MNKLFCNYFCKKNNFIANRFYIIISLFINNIGLPLLSLIFVRFSASSGFAVQYNTYKTCKVQIISMTLYI